MGCLGPAGQDVEPVVALPLVTCCHVRDIKSSIRVQHQSLWLQCTCAQGNRTGSMQWHGAALHAPAAGVAP